MVRKIVYDTMTRKEFGIERGKRRKNSMQFDARINEVALG